MSKRMLIDATHSEETRVAVVDGKRLVDFDYESKVRKQLKSSIFLAKVTRVEPSLQAAFVNFGGNRHGFLPFTEIHPDYYRIPIADREAILAEQEREMEARRAAEEAEDSEEEDESELEDEGTEDETPEDEAVEEEDEISGNLVDAEEDEFNGNVAVDEEEAAAVADEENNGNRRDGRRGGRHRRGRGHGRGGRRVGARARRVEVLGGDAVEGDQPLRPSFRRNYKIQEVIKRGQIMLVQVSKEERGNKGAAVSTYLSLPGRYCVLMPNSPRAGGVSRKIANFKERKRMREILNELKVPQGMSVIMRTAGTSRTKAEIKRDLDYLMKLWDNIRELTLESTAPALVHEEGNLVRRSIRDIYAPDIEEVIVAGEEGYKFARDFMKMMIPSHVKKVKEFKDSNIPLFHRYQVESQINEIGDPVVTLPSGGYLVINPTEALVSVDVNSGKSTKERHIEETALRTNLEAAEEVARQLRLRDLGGLIVVDFIDMEDRRNNRKVENRMRDALAGERARIQIGRISSFGLMELSRQRLNPSLTEAQFEKCAHCQGMGYVRTVDAAAIMALRALEEEGIRNRSSEVILHVSNAVALYILNNKRHRLAEIEKQFGFTVMIRVNDELAPSRFLVEPVKAATPAGASEDGEEREKPAEARPDRQERHAGGERGERGERGEHGENGERGSRRRRGRRGGRRRNNREERGFEDEFAPEEKPGAASLEAEAEIKMEAEAPEPEAEKEDVKPTAKTARKKAATGKKAKADEAGAPAAEETAGDEAKPAKAAAKKASGRKKAPAKKTVIAEDKGEEKAGGQAEPQPEAKPAPARGEASNDTAPRPPREYEVINEPPTQKKKGWWSKFTE